MPVTLKLTFPGGRYHATPWGRHVNEGVAEWPPSPWRLLRALVAVWKRTCRDLDAEQVKRVLTALAEPPRFHLPKSRVAHTRHYMPWEKKNPADRTLVFDTFVAVSRNDSLFLGWPEANLDDDEWKALNLLVDNLSSLGRAEGWVDGEAFRAGTGVVDWNCWKSTDADAGGELVPVFCPDPETAFGSEHYPPVKDAKKRKPADFLFDCPPWHLCLDTQTIHGEKWPRVPGSKWVTYVRRPYASNTTPKPPAEDRTKRPTVARFLLDGPVLPLVTDTVRVAEVFRAAAMSRFKAWCHKHPSKAACFRRTDKPDLYSSPVLSGKDAAGKFLRSGDGPHRHAYYLPTADGPDGRRITHVTVFARDGFGPGEMAALTRLRSVKLGDGDPLRVQLVGLGQPSDFTHWLFATAAVWESVTPFVAHRHLKRRGRKRDTPYLDGPDPKAAFVQRAAAEAAGRSARGEQPDEGGRRGATEFRRERSRSGDDGRRRACGMVRLSFPVPVAGPLAVGYACHYGLGLFRPV